MSNLNLSLRQRKLIHYLRFQRTYTTGEQLAKHLGVSARTIRNDVNEINELIAGTGVSIVSKRSSGYMIAAEDPDSLKLLSLSSDSFLSRDERIRYITTELCISDVPLNLYDLEDEMFVSRTTLEHDLAAMRRKYILPFPHIKFIRHKNHISFEKNERKRRMILNTLISENWNYNSRDNTYYRYQYLDERIVSLIMKETQLYTSRYDIQLEDINMITLNLAIAIMHYRITSGYCLTEPSDISYTIPSCVYAADELLNSLEEKLDCTFSALERQDIYCLLSCSRLIDAQKLNFGTAEQYFDSSVIAFTDSYIRLIRDIYHIDFSDNEDFYITILQYIRYLKLPIRNFNGIYAGSDITRSEFLIEFEIAYAIQPMALDFFGNYLDRTELLYLAFCISGALAYMNRNAPKLKTVILCHLNLPATWNLKHRILEKFHDYIDITALLPVYEKDIYDFSRTGLAITTADKKITDSPDCLTQVISPFFTIEDQNNLERVISKKQINRLYQPDIPTIRELFEHAFWHERMETETPFEIMKSLASDFINAGYVPEGYLFDILHRESILSFAFQPSFVLVYSNVPSSRTVLSVATLEHRVKWNSYKIRTVIMAAMRPEDATLIFRLINELYDSSLNPEESRFLKTREEWTNYFHL